MPNISRVLRQQVRCLVRRAFHLFRMHRAILTQSALSGTCNLTV